MRIYGPYLRKDGRKHIVIVHDDGRKQTKSYPKHLLEQKIGRELVGDETCDHIDEDFTNDALNNLQVLSRPKNIIKSQIAEPLYHFICPICCTPATRVYSQVKHNWKLGKSGPYCSKRCAGKVGK